MYLCAQNHDLKRGGTFETAKAGTFHSVTAGTLIPLFTLDFWIIKSKEPLQCPDDIRFAGCFLLQLWSKWMWYYSGLWQTHDVIGEAHTSNNHL